MKWHRLKKLSREVIKVENKRYHRWMFLLILINFSIVFSMTLFAFNGMYSQINREKFNRTVEMKVTTAEKDVKKIIRDIDKLESVEKSYFIKKTDTGAFEIHVILKDFSLREQMILSVPKYFEIVDVTLHKIESMLFTIVRIKQILGFVFLGTLLIQQFWNAYMIKHFFREFSYEIKLLSALGYSKKQMGCILGLPFLRDSIIGIVVVYGIQKIFIDVILDRIFQKMLFMRALEIHYSHSFMGDLLGFAILGIIFVILGLLNLRKIVSEYST